VPPLLNGEFPSAFTFVDFTASNVQVTAGDVLAIVLRTFDTAAGYFWVHKEGATYEGGRAFARNAVIPRFFPQDRAGGIPVDFGFRTFVQPDIPTIQDVIAAVNDAIQVGTLIGAGSGSSAAGRLEAWVNMVEAAAQLIASGNVVEGCSQLQDAHRRVDGVSPPPDFVAGDAVPVLARMIDAVRQQLGCSPLASATPAEFRLESTRVRARPPRQNGLATAPSRYPRPYSSDYESFIAR
jgi:hypothetical protein